MSEQGLNPLTLSLEQLSAFRTQVYNNINKII